MNDKPEVITVPTESTPTQTVSPPLENIPESGQKKFPAKKIIFLALGLIVIAELIWAATTLFKPANQELSSSSLTELVQKTTITLSSNSSQIKIGQTFNVDIKIASSQNTDGSDLIILYDTQYLSVESADGNPVILGSIYSEYPVNKIDKEGKIVVSGISSKDGGVVPNGQFGSITFKAKSSGNTQIKIDFKPNDTKETNIIAAGEGKDILEEVINLDLEILP